MANTIWIPTSLGEFSSPIGFFMGFFFARISIGLLSLSLAPFLYIYFPKLTQSAFISCLLGYIFAFSLPFLPTNFCTPSTPHPFLSVLPACLPAMPWGLESCRMRRRCRWGKINWSIATHNKRRRKSIQRIHHPPPPPPTILFYSAEARWCVVSASMKFCGGGKESACAEFAFSPSRTRLIYCKEKIIILSWPRKEGEECSVMVIGSINALKSIPLSISTIITGPVRHSVSPGFIFYRRHCQDHFTCPLSECPIKIFNSLLLQLALLQFPPSHSLLTLSCKNCLSTS